MKEIKLTQGKVALVDDEDYEWLNQWKWCAYGKKHVGYRASRAIDGCAMHILIMNPSEGAEIDHRDGNPLNNQKCNLRACTHQENMRNMKQHRDSKSPYKGITWYIKHKKWAARIVVDNKHKWLGFYDDPKDAARAYNKAALEYYGEFAKFNII